MSLTQVSRFIVLERGSGKNEGHFEIIVVNHYSLFLSVCEPYLPSTKSISIAILKLFQFHHFISRTSFSNSSLNKGYCELAATHLSSNKSLLKEASCLKGGSI